MASRVGLAAELAVLGQLAGRAHDITGFEAGDLARASVLIDRYRDRSIGVAEASVVVLAERYHTRHLLTLDHRHFGPLSGGRFKLLP